MNTTTSSRLNGRRLSILTALVGMSLAALAVFVVSPSEVWAGQQLVKVLGSAQTVSAANESPTPPTANVGPNDQPRAVLHAAKNEFESFQLYVKADANGIANLRVDPGEPLKQIDPVTGTAVANGASIPRENLTFYREHFLDITTRSDNEGKTGEWADALIPETDFVYGKDRKAFPYSVPAGGRAVAWVDVLVPEDLPSGTYKGSVLVKDDANAAPAAPGVNRGNLLEEVPVTIEVNGFKLESEATLDSAFMMSQDSSEKWKSDPCTGYDTSVCDTPEERWKLYAAYGRAGLENRVTIPNAFAHDVGKAPAVGTETDLFNQYGRPMIDGLGPGAGIGTPGYSRLDGAKLTVVGASEYCLSNDEYNPDTPAKYVYSDVCLKRWNDLATTPGHRFDDRFFLYTDDELDNVAEWEEFKHRVTLARQAWVTQEGEQELSTLITGPINNAVHPETGATLVEGAFPNGAVPKIDIQVALVNYMDNTECGNGAKVYSGNQREKAGAYPELFKAVNETAGTPANRLWMYTSDMSFSSEGCLQDGWPGYAIDQPDTEARAMGWMSYYYDTSGELYWQVTQTHDTAWTDQLTDNFNGGENAKGNGDGNLFYPGTVAMVGGDAGEEIPIESIRLKKIRDGREDYEYMKEIERRDRVDGAADPKKRVNDAIASIYGDKNLATKCPTLTRPSSPHGGCGNSAMYQPPSAADLEKARLSLWNMLKAGDPSGGEVTPPTSEVSPADGATGVAVTDPATATFNEAMDATTINGATFSLKKTSDNSAVGATVSYDAPTRKATLTPNANLQAGTKYTATLSGVKDAAQNQAVIKSWSFTTSGNVVQGTCRGEANTMTGSDDPNVPPDNLTGRAGLRDVIGARGGADTIGSLDNTDVACGGTEEDTFTRFGGSVVVDGAGDGLTDNASDVIDFSWITTTDMNGRGAFIKLSGTSDRQTAEGVVFEVTSYNVSDAIGSSFPDTMRGDNMRNTIKGGAGNDTISGGAEADPLRGDRIYGEDGNDTINVRDGSIDTVYCGSGTDAVEADANDRINDPNVTGEDCERVDTSAPVITPVSPKPDSAIRDRTPTIRATVRDVATDLAKGDVQLYVGQTLISDTKYSYNSDTDTLTYNSTRLPLGKNTVRVVATDSADSVGARAWSFTIRRR